MSILIMVTLILTGNLHAMEAGKNPFIRKFPIKEGIVTYTTRGNHRGSQVLYFSDFGQKQLLVENMQNDILQKKNRSRKVILTLPDARYIVYLKDNTAQKSIRLEKSLNTLFQKLIKKEQEKILANLQKTAPRSYENISGSCTEKSKEIAGYRCNEEQMDGIHTCSIAGGALTLEKKITLLGYNIDTFATKITAKKVDPKLFTLPKNIKILKTKDTTPQKAALIIDNLLNNPEGCQKGKENRSGENLHLMMYEEIQNLSKNF